MKPTTGFLKDFWMNGGGLFLGVAADLADHHDGLGRRVRSQTASERR